MRLEIWEGQTYTADEHFDVVSYAQLYLIDETQGKPICVTAQWFYLHEPLLATILRACRDHVHAVATIQSVVTSSDIQAATKQILIDRDAPDVAHTLTYTRNGASSRIRWSEMSEPFREFFESIWYEGR